MTGKILVLTFVVIMTAVVVGAETTYRATLAGSREVPGPGDNGASGLAVATVDGSTLYYFLYVHNTAVPTAAHIHVGDIGSSGGVLLGLVSDGGGFSAVGGSSYIATGSLTLSGEQASALSGDPAGHYFNVHNADHPAGAVRGQLLGDGAADRMFATDLRGGREVPSPGDGDGRGFAAFAIDGGRSTTTCGPRRSQRRPRRTSMAVCPESPVGPS